MESQFSHTFAVCAYKESEYLEDCVKSLINQSVKTNIIMCTSTPCEYISNIANKYNIPLYIREGKSDIRDDWNFAYNTANTKWVTVAHQDDEYNVDYVKYLKKRVAELDNATMFFSDYLPIKHGEIGERDINSKIRRFLRIPMKSNRLAGKKFWKKRILSLGNSICCPSVAYNKKRLGDNVFTSELKFNIDWETFYKLAMVPGEFAYVDKPLNYYRVHDGATSMEFIVSHKREIDDTYMFNLFWPKWVTKLIMVFYKKAYKTYM